MRDNAPAGFDGEFRMEQLTFTELEHDAKKRKTPRITAFRAE
ncbi:MAG: hypothetical protein OXF43_11610 [Gammaproteobacteria bacterium]|nr:hypothetical protein [Gammaproteobacteria bacterium]MCY4183516.1 hypothetical protein [Gammaproteobacteria bacterium]